MPADMLLHAAHLSTLVACAVLKLPQILVLVRARSSCGLSLHSLLLELAGFVVFMTYQVYYDYPPPTYLEYPILIAQDAVMLLLILHYNQQRSHALLYALLFVGGWRLVTVHKWMVDLAMVGRPEGSTGSDAAPLTCALSPQSLCTVISAASKFAQLQCLWRSKDAGQVSALSWLLAVYTCAARIYTTAVTTGDVQVLVRFMVTTSLNAWVLLTVLHYQKRGGGGAKKQD
ncbi:solute carrier family 66 member 3 isoform X1 [Synchiropus splendidus]|uniref:solute carrier family 66 member 3 isoform X1 n=1 Tax=Synchiropus splendidus TaxID=270530 RepID=UPI00237E2D42|nr:solute carrier family 66 member 3 isoform X1 [Synchiropus splendidus]